MLLWEKEHPGALNDIDPEFIKTLDDQSWRNDALPSFTKNVCEKTCLVIFIDYENPDDREMDLPSDNRFWVYLAKREGESYDMTADDPMLYQGNDLDALKRVIAENT